MMVMMVVVSTIKTSGCKAWWSRFGELLQGDVTSILLTATVTDTSSMVVAMCIGCQVGVERECGWSCEVSLSKFTQKKRSQFVTASYSRVALTPQTPPWPHTARWRDGGGTYADSRISRKSVSSEHSSSSDSRSSSRTYWLSPFVCVLCSSSHWCATTHASPTSVACLIVALVHGRTSRKLRTC